MNRSQKRALKHSKIGHTAEYARLVKQRSAISRTAIHYRYNKAPVVLHRYMGVNVSVCVSKVTARP